MTTSERDEIAGLLREHRPGFAWVCVCGEVQGETSWANHLADLLAARDRRVTAGALREAADAALRGDTGSPADMGESIEWSHWLRDRASRIEQGDGGER
jgi:hypothetical protein